MSHVLHRLGENPQPSNRHRLAVLFSGQLLASTRRKERTLHWLATAWLLLTIPAFYLQLVQNDTAHNIAAWRAGNVLYAAAGIGMAGYLVLLWHIREKREASGFWVHRSVDLAICVGALLSIELSPGQWSTAEWIVRLCFSALVAARIVFSFLFVLAPLNLILLLAAGGTTLALAGAGFYWLEPTVHSYADGLWLAFASGATVGYGDLVPTTPASRVFAGFVVLLGLVLLSAVTASLAALLVGAEEQRFEQELHRDIRALHHEVALLRNELLSLRDHDLSAHDSSTRSSKEAL